MDIYSKILSSLASGEKTRAEIAAAIKLPPPKVAGALVTLVSSGKVDASGKTWSRGKEVTIYAIANEPQARQSKPIKPYQALSNEDIAKLKAPTKLYQIWGGYAPLDAPASITLSSIQHTQN